MNICVYLYGTLRRFSQKDTPGIWQGDLPSGTRIIDLIQHIGAETREVALASINNCVCSFDDEIPAGAEVLLVTHIGGG